MIVCRDWRALVVCSKISVFCRHLVFGSADHRALWCPIISARHSKMKCLPLRRTNHALRPAEHSTNFINEIKIQIKSAVEISRNFTFSVQSKALIHDINFERFNFKFERSFKVGFAVVVEITLFRRKKARQLSCFMIGEHQHRSAADWCVTLRSQISFCFIGPIIVIDAVL